MRPAGKIEDYFRTQHNTEIETTGDEMSWDRVCTPLKEGDRPRGESSQIHRNVPAIRKSGSSRVTRGGFFTSLGGIRRDTREDLKPSAGTDGRGIESTIRA